MKLIRLTIFLILLLSVTLVQSQNGDTLTDDQYEPDNTYEAATPIAIDETQTHSLTYQDVDYYTFTINATKILEILVSVSSSSLLITLYDGDLALIASKHDYHAVEELKAGTYYFKLQSQYEGATLSSYDAALHDLKSLNEPNDDTDSATFLPMNQSMRESITYVNSFSDVDYFYFNITKSAYYDLKIVTRIYSIYVSLLDSSNQVVSQFEQRYQNHGYLHSLQLPLNAGKYYVEIQGFDQSGLYNISLFMLFDDQYEPNDSIIQASTLPFNTKVNATIMNFPDSNLDIWKISPQITARYTIRLYGPSIFDITIQDSNLFDIGNMGRSSYNLLLDPDDYFITVESSSYSGNYSLSYTYMFPEGNEPNDDPTHATELDSIYEVTPQNEFYPFNDQPRNFHNDSDVDWYKFPLTESLTFKLDPYATINSYFHYPIEFSIYDENLLIVSTFVNRSLVFLQPGIYYIKASQVISVIDYYLRVNSIYPDDYESDDNPENATLLSSLDIQLHTLHISDDEDWFYFELNEKRPISVRLDGNGGDDLEMYLYSSDLNQIAYNDDYNGNTFPTIRQELKQGIYYVKVQSQIKEATVDPYEIIFVIWNANGSDTSISSRLKVGYSFLNNLTSMSVSFVTLLILKKHFRKKNSF